jgi:GMP synthase (glutamine-hydrolysing)
MSTHIVNKFGEINRCVYCLAGEEADLEVKPGDLSEDRIEVLQWVDHLVHQEMRYEEEWEKVWQMPVVLIPCGTDGKESIVLRPVESQEAMTANFAELPFKKMEEIANVILNDSKVSDHISHVFFDVTHKPPGTIEWE